MKRGGAEAKASSRADSVRCAIYTRKSSDEGLEQDFNSLDAQREACAAYILSQASEGWYEVSARYDDGGISGGTLERPALQRLLADVAAGQIDIIVVYKVDRLTRSLLDFAKLVETFDKADASFVSITQAFNTTTSMGRLTLNMLLSFAQFEREVTAERIRDKIAASKARGMWMGGIPPLGYKPDGRTLAVVEEHAAVVRHIFERYLALRNTRLLELELKAQDIKVPVRMTAGGKPIGGGSFSRGLLHVMLRRVTYDGQIAHGDKVYVGNHPAIVDRDTFTRAQLLLTENTQGERTHKRIASPSLLAGRIFDAEDVPLTSTHATKGKTRYRYYVSRALHQKESDTGLRVPAREIETLVANRVSALFGDPIQLIATAWLDIPESEYLRVTRFSVALAAQQRQRSREALTMIERVHVGADRITVTCNTATIAAMLNVTCHPQAPTTLELADAARLSRTGRAIRLVQDSGALPAPTVDHALVTAIIRARRWWGVLREGELDITRLAQRERVSPAFVTRIVRLAFLAPRVTEAILAGRQRAGVDVRHITVDAPPVACWKRQQTAMLPD